MTEGQNQRPLSELIVEKRSGNSKNLRKRNL